jgi:hypothetical protein
MRQKYANSLGGYITRLGKEAKTRSDVKELERQFKDEMRQDLQDLKKELDLASIKTLFSKEVALAVLILAGTFVAPVAGMTALGTQIGGVGIIPLVKAAVNYRAAHREALRKHVMSWLFLTKQGPITLR